MDLQSLIESRKQCLKSCATIVTDALGRRYQVINGKRTELAQGSPFVVDLKPDLEVAIIRPGLFLSSQDPALNVDILKQHGIRHVLSIGIEPSVHFDTIQYYYCDLLDLPESDIRMPIKTCVQIIHQCRHENILVHCNAGVSRSATIVIAYLMVTENLSYTNAYDDVKLKRHQIKPNDGFIRQLKSLNISNFFPV